MPSRERPITPAGQSLRRSPWLLVPVALIAILARVATGTTSHAWWWLVGTLIVAAVLILSWRWRLDSQAQREGKRLHAFACSTAPQLERLRRVPQFQDPLRQVRLGFLVGLPMGRLLVSSSGISWTPNAWTHRILGAPRLHLDWSEIAEAVVVKQLGPGSHGILDIRLTNRADCAFMITRRDELAAYLDELRVERPAVASIVS